MTMTYDLWQVQLSQLKLNSNSTQLKLNSNSTQTQLKLPQLLLCKFQQLEVLEVLYNDNLLPATYPQLLNRSIDLPGVHRVRVNS